LQNQKKKKIPSKKILLVMSPFMSNELLFNFPILGCIPVSIFLVVIAYIGCNRTATVILLCLSIITSGAIFVGHLCNQNDLAPNYAGTLMGITNTPGTISAFVIPALVGALVENGVR
jgi:ACS family sodium-dependent inorganic phosphate cotransporter